MLEKVNEAIKVAMKEKSSNLEALRAIKSELMILETSGKNVDTDLQNQTLQKMIKQRTDAANIYENAGEFERANQEKAQIEVIKGFLPKQLTQEEIKEQLLTIISELNVTSISEKGKVMGVATKKMKGLANGNDIMNVLATLLK